MDDASDTAQSKAWRGFARLNAMGCYGVMVAAVSTIY